MVVHQCQAFKGSVLLILLEFYNLVAIVILGALFILRVVLCQLDEHAPEFRRIANGNDEENLIRAV